MKSSTRRIPTVVLAVTIAATLLTTAFIISNNLLKSVFAQQPQPQPTQQQQQKAPLNFYLKLANNASTSQAASQAAANGTGTKNMTITVNVQKGPGGQQIPLPISAVVPANIQPQDMQLCASLSDGSESCQPLSGGQQGASIDLTQSAAEGTMAASPTATTSPMPMPPPTRTMTPSPAPVPQSYSNTDGVISTKVFAPLVDTMTSIFAPQQAYAQLISVEDTTLNIPITVIVPIELNIQNAQICASVASSGGQTCQQIVLNPTQTSYSPVDVNLAQPTPAVMTQGAAAPTTPAPTTTPTTTPPSVTTTPQPTDQMQAQVCPPLCGPTSPTTTTPGDQPEPQPMPPETSTEEQPSTSEDQAPESTEGSGGEGEGGSTDGTSGGN